MFSTSPPPTHHGSATSHKKHKNATTRRNGRRLVRTNTSVWRIVLSSLKLPPPACPALLVHHFTEAWGIRNGCAPTAYTGPYGLYRPSWALQAKHLFTQNSAFGSNHRERDPGGGAFGNQIEKADSNQRVLENRFRLNNSKSTLRPRYPGTSAKLSTHRVIVK